MSKPNLALAYATRRQAHTKRVQDTSAQGMELETDVADAPLSPDSVPMVEATASTEDTLTKVMKKFLRL